MKAKLGFLILTLAAVCSLSAKSLTPTISGDYLEVRSCDVYTGPCVANAEMNLSGKEGMLVWRGQIMLVVKGLIMLAV